MNVKIKTFAPVTGDVRIQTGVTNAIVQTAMRATKTIFVWVSNFEYHRGMQDPVKHL